MSMWDPQLWQDLWPFLASLWPLYLVCLVVAVVVFFFNLETHGTRRNGPE